jgi:hypothetical protein
MDCDEPKIKQPTTNSKKIKYSDQSEKKWTVMNPK